MVFNSILLGLTSFKSPLLRGIVPCVAAAFGCQFLAGAPSIFFGTERFYDLSGSLTYLAVGALSLYLPALRSRAAAQASGVPAPPLPGLVDMVKSVSSVGGAGGAGARDWRQVAATAMVVIWATRRKYYSHTCKQDKTRHIANAKDLLQSDRTSSRVSACTVLTPASTRCAISRCASPSRGSCRLSGCRCR